MIAKDMRIAELIKYSTSSLFCAPDSPCSFRPPGVPLIYYGLGLLPSLAETSSALNLPLARSGLDLLPPLTEITNPSLDLRGRWVSRNRRDQEHLPSEGEPKTKNSPPDRLNSETPKKTIRLEHEVRH